MVRILPRCFLVASFWLASLAFAGFGWAETPAGKSDREAFFEREIRPLLSAQCFSCHGPRKQEGNLRLDSRSALLKGGDTGSAVTPGKPDTSLLIKAIRRTGELKMPPNKSLNDRQVAALTHWVELGCFWPNPKSTPTSSEPNKVHWAFQPIKKTNPPEVKLREWTRNPIDRFVLAKLESSGLKPSPEADRRTMIRRLTVDLTGLPPSPMDVDSFVRDRDDQAYEKLVDRLLGSPQFGEQWARHWLDVARYSDTKGYVYGREERFWVHASAYRDWVVNAFNRDMPFDHFVLLQLAADQVATEDPAAQAAMGFLTLNRRFLGVTHDIIDDRIDVVSRGLLGLTVSCARCHDHKFDPIPTADYYSLYGVFQNCSERMVPASPPAPAPPKAFVDELKKRQQTLDVELAKERAAASQRVRTRVGDYLLAQLELQKYPEEGFDQFLSTADVIPASVRRWRDTLAMAALRNDRVFAAWRMYARLSAGDFAKRAVAVSRELVANSAVNPRVVLSFAEPPKDMRDVAMRYGKLLATVEKEWQAALAESQAKKNPAPTKLADPASEELRLLLYGPVAPCEVPNEPIVHVEVFFPTPTCERLWKLQGEVDRWLIRNPAAPAVAIALKDRPSLLEPVIFKRGNAANRGDMVPRQFPALLSGAKRTPFANGSGRLELARAIVDPNNPMTARVIVNRLWMHHFGAGLVRTPSDFGTRAAAPSHPELLDWLATQLIDNGWHLKAIHRQIVLSAAYRQASTGPDSIGEREKASGVDPENRLLWRASPRRLSFEETRDAMLAAAGTLDRTMGGRPVELFAAPFPVRRSLYGLIDREFFPSTLRVFDVANPDLHTPLRSETTVPQQALFFLNHPFALEVARRLAGVKSVADNTNDADRVNALYQRVFQRPPTALELQRALSLLTSSADAAPKPRPTAGAWQYGFGVADPKTGQLSKFKPLPYFTGSAWQGGPKWPDSKLGWVQVTASGGHAGNDMQHAAVRRWTAPVDGIINVRSTLDHPAAEGHGVRGSIVSSRHGVLKYVNVHHRKEPLEVKSLVVKKGDTFDFVVTIHQSLDHNEFEWSPTLEWSEKGLATTWDALADFTGPMVSSLNPLEQLAQVLLMSNEFSFVD